MAFDIEGVITGMGQARKWLAETVAKTPDDRLDWRPPCDGGGATTISEQLKHLIAAEGDLCGVLADAPPHMPEGEGGDYFASSSFATSGPAAGLRTKEELLRAVEERGAATDAALRAIPAEQWGKTMDVGWHKGPKAEFAHILAIHWYYHLGQIAYVQRLYGDTTF